jgi:hypothetical protein
MGLHMTSLDTCGMRKILSLCYMTIYLYMKHLEDLHLLLKCVITNIFTTVKYIFYFSFQILFDVSVIYMYLAIIIINNNNTNKINK